MELFNEVKFDYCLRMKKCVVMKRMYMEGYKPEFENKKIRIINMLKLVPKYGTVFTLIGKERYNFKLY